MSKETYEWLNKYCLIGYTNKRGNAWHYREDKQSDEPNHYTEAIPVDDVIRRLYSWEAQEAPVYVKWNDTFRLETDRKAIVRSDNGSVLGMFKESYAIHQYKSWLIETVSHLLDDDLNIGSAGILKNGAVSFVSVEMPENITILDNFSVRPMLLATTSHNGSISTTFKTVSTRVECDNLLAHALGEKTSTFRARHSKNSNFRLQSVRDALGFVHRMTDDIIAEVNKYATVKVSDREWDAIVNRLMPINADPNVAKQAISRVENKQERLRDLYRNDPIVAPFTGTALGVIQAFNTFNQHHVGKDSNRVERNMMNALTGKVEASDRLVMDAIQQLVMV
jgi:phage/plasmid-like protein (TIGR03299 family)